MYLYDKECIVALATPPGQGALAIIRLSGTNLANTYQALCGKKPKHRIATYVKICHPKTKKFLDNSIIIFFKGPHSFTGEDVIEISCHGGKIIPNTIIQSIIEYGARNALPGEFSYRSFMNGKIDLIQAESISSIIDANSAASVDIGLNHLNGIVSNIFKDIKTSSLNIMTVIENELNFSEEEIEVTTHDEIAKQIKDIKNKISDVLNSSLYNNRIINGISAVIVGKANSGKSSLFNAILGHNRSIVSKQKGTTRDSIEANVNISTAVITLIDTAGIWESSSFLDNIAINNTKYNLEKADICIIVDEKDPKNIYKKYFSKIFSKKCFFVKSKCDSMSDSETMKNHQYKTSAIKGRGLNKLLTDLSTHINTCTDFTLNEHASVAVNARQRAVLESSLLILDEILTYTTNNIETDIIASSLRAFINNIKEIIGDLPNDEIINNVFSSFCIGK